MRLWELGQNEPDTIVRPKFSQFITASLPRIGDGRYVRVKSLRGRYYYRKSTRNNWGHHEILSQKPARYRT